MNEVLYKTMRQFFPGFNNWIKTMKDPRDKDLIEYPIQQMTWFGILIFMLRLGARRQMNFKFNTQCARENLSVLTGTEVESITHDTNLSYFLKKLGVEELIKLRSRMINRLIRMKVLSRFRIEGHYPVSVDATGQLVFDYEHCEHCLRQEHKDGRVYYYHPVLEAKIVVPNGMALSIATEFIENKDGKDNTNTEKAKQDCELKAFKRLAEQLKRDFPQLKICLLLDGLYANASVFEICRKNGWKYIITFKKGSMPATFQEYQDIKKMDEECENVDEYEDEAIKQDYQWVNDIDYKDYKLNVLECQETDKNKKKKKTFIFVTNFKIHYQNVRTLHKGGRLRWKTENEGFNTQKNQGYQLEHAYSQHPVAIKNFYILLQIAHIINQLMEKGSLLADQIQKVFGSLKNISDQLLECLRTSVLGHIRIRAINNSRYQIRLADP